MASLLDLLKNKKIYALNTGDSNFFLLDGKKIIRRFYVNIVNNEVSLININTGLTLIRVKINYITINGNDVKSLSEIEIHNLLSDLVFSDNSSGGGNNTGNNQENVTPITPPSRAISYIKRSDDGTTIADVRSLTIEFVGDAGTLNGVEVDNGDVITYADVDGVKSINYTVPTDGFVKISYIL